MPNKPLQMFSKNEGSLAGISGSVAESGTSGMAILFESYSGLICSAVISKR